MRFWKYAVFGLLALSGCGGDKAEPQASVPATAADAPASPALWKISDVDTTVYFFGTVHVLPPGFSWRSPAVDKALEESRAIYFETDTEIDPIVFRGIVERLGKYEPSDQLSDHLSAADHASLAAALDKLGLPMVAIQTMRPWYAGIVISEAVVRNAGYDASSGVENVLRPTARKAGKDLRFLETVEEQMASFATLPEPVEVRFLIEGLADIDNASKGLADLVNAWKAGDVAALDRVLIDEDMGRIPELYAALLTHRNANWAPEIDALMKTEAGTFLVAVGTAHLVGKESLLEMLKPMGYVAERVQ